MAHQFELFRFSLHQRKQMDIEGEEFKDFSREQWLRKVFSEKQPFLNYGSVFYYVPSDENSDEDEIIGRVGRHVVREENKPPEEGLEDFMHETWLAAIIVIDPSHHDDGQKLAIQNITDVGKPITLIRSLLRSINERYKFGPYAIEVGPIIETQSFWNFAEENSGKITSVSFELVVPNMFGSSDDWDEDMRQWREEEHARKLRLTINNSDGTINPNTKKIQQAVSYAERNSGIIKARAKNNKRYNSGDTSKRSYLEGIEESGVELFRSAKNFAGRILGRE